MSPPRVAEAIGHLQARFAIEVRIRRTLSGKEQVRDLQVRLLEHRWKIEASARPLNTGFIDLVGPKHGCLTDHQGLIEEEVIPHRCRGWGSTAAAAQKP